MRKEIIREGMLTIDELSVHNVDLADGSANARWIIISIANGFLEVTQQADNFITVKGQRWILDAIYDGMRDE